MNEIAVTKVWGEGITDTVHQTDTAAGTSLERFALSKIAHKKLCGSTSISSLIEPCFFGAAASHSRK
jgi:hypothetical protein